MSGRIIDQPHAQTVTVTGRNPSGSLQEMTVDSTGALILSPVSGGGTVGTASLNSSSSSAVSLIAAGAAGIFNDIISLTITNESSTATIVSLSDNGAAGNVYKFAIAANGGLVFNPAIPLPQGTAAAAWNVKNSAAVALDFVVIYLPSTVAV